MDGGGFFLCLALEGFVKYYINNMDIILLQELRILSTKQKGKKKKNKSSFNVEQALLKIWLQNWTNSLIPKPAILKKRKTKSTFSLLLLHKCICLLYLFFSFFSHSVKWEKYLFALSFLNSFLNCKVGRITKKPFLFIGKGKSLSLKWLQKPAREKYCLIKFNI